MKILHLLNSNQFSGAENVVCQIIHVMKDYPEYEHIYCSLDGQIRQALEERAVIFAPISTLSVGEVRRVLREQEPDLIHAHDMRAGFVAALAAGRTPIISHIHNNNFDSRGISIKSLAYLFVGLKAKHIFWVSESSYQGYFFHSLLKKKSEVLYNIIDIDVLYRKMQTDTSDYDYDIVYVGRLTYQKNPQRLLYVMKRVVATLPDVKVAIVGNGDMEEETKALSKELGLERNVSFLGFQSNPLKIMHDAKVMLMTSRWEGTPMCALEAMALGVPIVTTPTDGLGVLVRNGETGYLDDNDSMLAMHVVDLINNRSLHEVCSDEAKKVAVEFNNLANYGYRIESQYKLYRNI